MPTAHNSPIYKNDFPKVDAASIILLRDAGVLFLGKSKVYSLLIKGRTGLLTCL